MPTMELVAEASSQLSRNVWDGNTFGAGSAGALPDALHDDRAARWRDGATAVVLYDPELNRRTVKFDLVKPDLVTNDERIDFN